MLRRRIDNNILSAYISQNVNEMNLEYANGQLSSSCDRYTIRTGILALTIEKILSSLLSVQFLKLFRSCERRPVGTRASLTCSCGTTRGTARLPHSRQPSLVRSIQLWFLPPCLASRGDDHGATPTTTATTPATQLPGRRNFEGWCGNGLRRLTSSSRLSFW